MENLGIDLKLLIAQAINFALFFLIFKRFLAKPFTKFIQDERKIEADKIRLEEETRKKEEELAKKQEVLENKMKQRSDNAILEAKEAAESVRKEILDQANEEANKLKEKARKQMADEKEHMMKDIQQKVFDLSVFMVNTALKDVLSVDVKKKITQLILKNSEKKPISL